MLGCYEEPEFKPYYVKWELEADALIAKSLRDRAFSAPVLAMMRNPENFPSALRRWRAQGGIKAQQLFTKSSVRRRFVRFYTRRLRTGHARSIYRSQLGSYSSAFLTTVPRCATFKYTNEEFMYSFRSRCWMHQPLVSACRLMKCSCGGKVSEEHIIKCKHDTFRSQTHFALQMCVFGMLRHAGILATLEPRYLLPSQASRRQADVMGHGCRLHETSTFTEVGIDVGVVYPDHKLEKSQRYVGTRAHHYCRHKRKHRRTEETLKTRGMKYFPAVVETNGVPSKSCATLIKQIASVAKDQRGHNETYFRSTSYFFFSAFGRVCSARVLLVEFRF